MTSIALCCPGPGLHLFTEGERRRHDKILAVNRAALAVRPFHWWVALDGWQFAAHAVCPLIGICTGRSVCERLRARQIEPAGSWHVRDSADPDWIYCLESEVLPNPFGGRGHNYSVTAALALALAPIIVPSGDQPVHVTGYGMAMHGATDWDGHTHRQYRRDEERWAKERADIATFCQAHPRLTFTRFAKERV